MPAVGSGVPEPKGRQPVAVHMLGSALKFSKCRNGVPGFCSELVIDFQQDGFVALYYQWTVGHS